MLTLCSRPLLAAALVACVAAEARADEATAHGVTVSVPAGFRWLQDPPKKPASTVIWLQADGGGDLPAVLLVNHGIAPAGATEESIFEGYREYADDPKDAQVVDLPSGRFLRVDFTVPRTDGRTLRQRCYATLRAQHLYSFFLSNVEVARFAEYAPTLDALVAAARFGPPPPPATPNATGPTAATPPKPSPPAQPPRPTQPGPTQPAQPAPAPTPQPAPQPARPAPQPVKPAPPPQPQPVRPTPPAPDPQPIRPDPQPTATTPPPAPRTTPAPGRAPDLLSRATLVRFDSEYDATVWAAAHLLDGRADRGWCSSPRARGPHSFVFALEQPARLARLVLDNGCPEEKGFEGVSAAGFTLEVSNDGAEGPFKPVLEGTLVRGQNDQAFDLPAPVDARWLRLTVRGNHGHATLTELMDVRAYAEGALPPPSSGAAGSFLLDRVRASRARNGAPVEATDAFKPGERVWINVKPRGLATGPEQKAWLEIDLILEDAQGRELLRRDRVVDHVARPPAAPLSPFVAMHLDLPKEFPAGTYTVRLVARDRIAQTSAAALCPFVVAAPPK